MNTNTTNKKNRTKVNDKKNNFLVQGSILAIAGILVRIIGLVKRIPLTNIIGDEGNGFYGAAYGVYNIVLIISCYSLPLAVSKLVSARVTKGQYRNANKVFRGALVFAVLVGGGLGALVYYQAEFFAEVVMLEPMSMLALKVLGPTIFIVAVMGVLRGYFQGLGTTIPTALSQVIEQIFVAGIGLIAAYFLFDYGAKVGLLRMNDSFDSAFGAVGGTLGTSAGALAGLLFLIFIYGVYKHKLRKQIEKDVTKTEESYVLIFKILIMTIVPVILSTVVYHVSDIIDQRLFNQVMISKGLEDIKAVQWGIYSGKYKVLINIPIAISTAMCASLVPTLINSKEKKLYKEIRNKVASVIRFTMIIIIPCAVGIGVLAEQIISFLFSGDVVLAAQLLKIGSISTVFFSLSTLGNGVLQGINKVKIPVKNALIALVFHVISLYIMLEFMDLGIQGVVISTVIFSFLMCILNYLSIKKYLKYRQEIARTFIIPTICASAMGFIIYLINLLLHKTLNETVLLFISIIVGIAVYFVLLILLRGITERELSKIPFGNIIIKITRVLGILNKN